MRINTQSTDYVDALSIDNFDATSKEMFESLVHSFIDRGLHDHDINDVSDCTIQELVIDEWKILYRQGLLSSYNPVRGRKFWHAITKVTLATIAISYALRYCEDDFDRIIPFIGNELVLLIRQGCVLNSKRRVQTHIPKWASNAKQIYDESMLNEDN